MSKTELDYLWFVVIGESRTCRSWWVGLDRKPASFVGIIIGSAAAVLCCA